MPGIFAEMNLFAVFNRDGGTFKTTDMSAYCAHATKTFKDAGHEIECHVVAGDKVVETMERAASTPGVEALIAGGGDGTISAAARIAWKGEIALGVVPAGTMNLFARSLRPPSTSSSTGYRTDSPSPALLYCSVSMATPPSRAIGNARSRRC